MKNYFYLIHIQYLGYRFHGWAIQPNVKTVQLMIEKTVAFVLEHKDFKVLGSGRTDAKVSANHMCFELFLKNPIHEADFLKDFNSNLPNDIRALKIEPTDAKFNIIQSPKTKEYMYFFAHNEKPHPFSAPLISTFQFSLDIELMKKGAELFEGTHNFKKYCTKPSPKTQFERTVTKSVIEENDIYSANFFPTKSYVYHIHSKGFMRYQVRLMMGQLILLGKGDITLDILKDSMLNPDATTLDYIAPPSGLILHKINFE